MSDDALLAGLRAGDRRALAKAITLCESTRADDTAAGDALLEAVAPFAGGALRVGISGLPGAGKSTLIEALGLQAIGAGRRVAVLAIDPSSELTGGSILGDKTRMEQLAANDHAFIRPTASAGRLGGVADATRDAVSLCEAAGYDLVLVETVGVGQSEAQVAELVDLMVLVQLAHGGDDLQAIKRGVLERADVLVINKADLDRTAAERAAGLLRTGGEPTRPVLVSSARDGDGIAALWQLLLDGAAQRRADGRLRARRDLQLGAAMWRAAEQQRLDELRRDPDIAARANGLQRLLADGGLTPRTAARRLLAGNATASFPSPGASGPGNRPFRVLGLQQVAIGALDRARLHALWVDLLGIESVGRFASERENVDEEICAVGHGVARVEIDLMQPLDPQRRPAVHEPALNHIGLWVDDLREAVDWLTARGLRFAPGGIRRGAAGHDVCFIHPRGADGFAQAGEGVLIELVQAPPQAMR